MKTNQVNKVVVDKTLLLRRVIIISWITLALCFVVKIFGGNFFEIMCNNPNYIALCEYADTHFWCKYLICFLSSMVCEILYLLAIMQKVKPSKKDLVLTISSMVISCFVQLLANKWTIITDIWIFFGLPCVLIGKEYKKYFSVIIAWLITFLFQIISLVVKNLAIKPVDDSTFISLIYMIDLYIMCILYYLYRNLNKEKKTMGAFWGMFAGKPVDKLKEMKAKREKQIAKLNEEIKAIEAEIAKQIGKK